MIILIHTFSLAQPYQKHLEGGGRPLYPSSRPLIFAYYPFDENSGKRKQYMHHALDCSGRELHLYIFQPGPRPSLFGLLNNARIFASRWAYEIQPYANGKRPLAIK